MAGGHYRRRVRLVVWRIGRLECDGWDEVDAMRMMVVVWIWRDANGHMRISTFLLIFGCHDSNCDPATHFFYNRSSAGFFGFDSGLFRSTKG